MTTAEEKNEEAKKKAAAAAEAAKASAEEEEEDDEEEDDDAEESSPGSSNGRSDHAGAGKAGKSHAQPSSAVVAIGTLPNAFVNTMTIASRELKAYFDSLVAYVVLGGSLLGLGVYFFFYQGGFWQVDRATMARMFEFMPWALGFLVIPLVTMRALAEEKRSGTLELLITLPVRDAEVILGKYFAALAMCLILLAATFLYPLAMFKFPWHLGDLDWGPVGAAYFGLALFSAAGVAFGLLVSSVTDSQIIAFFVTSLVLVAFLVSGSLVEQSGSVAADTISFVSFYSRYLPFARGLVDTRSIVYYLSIVVLCLLRAFRSLESRKWS